MRRLLIIGSLFAIAVMGCKSNPYPAEGEYFQTPIIERPVLPPYSLDVPTTVDFTENFKGSFEIKALVPAPFVPEVTVENLPRGAVHDKVNSKVEWTPDFTQGNNPNDPTMNTMVYKIRVTLRGSGDSVTAISREVALIVRDAPRPLTLKSFSPNMSGKEGEELKHEVVVEDTDYPQGPFQISLDGLPSDVIIERGADTSRVTLKYTPGFRVVTSSGTASWFTDYKHINWSVTVTNPRGATLKVPVSWSIADARQPVRIVAPTLIDRGFGDDPNVQWGQVGPVGNKITIPTGISKDMTVSFMVHAEDPNGETIPVISSLDPEAGEIEIVPVAEFKGDAVSNPSKTVQVVWSKIPTSFKGKISEVAVQSCTMATNLKMDACVVQPVKVKFLIGAN